MMQLLGFRGGGGSPSPAATFSSPRSGDPRNPNPSGPDAGLKNSLASASTSYSSFNVTPGLLGPARPLRLVYCDEKGVFRMDPEAVATLQLVKGPVGVVSVCGRARQGKSFILNQLLGRSSGFQVASTHRPCTKGLWMWSAPLKQTAFDGTEYNLVLLDTEGIDAYDQTGTYSTQIFSLAVLLSSMFIYNQMGGIDEAALDNLSLVTEMTKHIRLRASGRRSTAAELGQFSPVFVWLLRDFYLDLAEDNRKIAPRDYLELALRPVRGGGKDVSSKNEIRESIHALFPERECFTLVRPLNDETDLQRLDQIPLERLRPEFRSNLDALAKFVFERTKPKQAGASVMTGPILAGITQSFLDAINNGAVPTIFSSWQSVEEAECRRAYDSATKVYMSSFDRTKPADEDVLREAHEEAVQNSLAVYNAGAVGATTARLNYEKLLQNFVKKAFEDYKRAASLEAGLRCSNSVQSMQKKLLETCHHSDTTFDSVIKVLQTMLLDYEMSCHGPSKWKILATFIRECFEGPIMVVVKKQLDKLDSERSYLLLHCRSNEDQMELLRKQLESNDKHRSEYLKRYENAISDKQKVANDLGARIVNLQSKCSTLEERCMSLSEDHNLVKNESSGWRVKFAQACLQLKAEEEKFKSQKAALESRINAAEVRLAAAREQALSAQEEASVWKQKYDVAAGEAKTALQKVTFLQELTNKKTREREDAIREEFSVQFAEKEEETKSLNVKLGHMESHATILVSKLEATESKVANYELETSNLKIEIRDLIEKLDSVKAMALSYEKQSTILEQEKNHLQEKLLCECKKFDDVEERSKAAEREAKRVTELADAATAEVFSSQNEKSEAQRLALERLAVIENVERIVDGLEQEKASLMTEVNRLHQSERDALSKLLSLERQVNEREKEIEDLLSRSNEQRSNTVQVLESLLATERIARAEANSRAEALSLQLQFTQGKLDVLHQELTSVRLNETALDSKLKTVSHGKHPRALNHFSTESIQNMEVDEGALRGRKRSKSTTSPFKHVQSQDGGSIYRGHDYASESQGIEDSQFEDYTRFTVLSRN